MMFQQRMVSFKGQEWDRKDATFERASEVQPITAGEDNGHFGPFLAQDSNEFLDLTENSVVHPGRQGPYRGCAQHRWSRTGIDLG